MVGEHSRYAIMYQRMAASRYRFARVAYKRGDYRLAIIHQQMAREYYDRGAYHARKVVQYLT